MSEDEKWLNETGKLAVKLMADARGVSIWEWLRDAVSDQIHREALAIEKPAPEEALLLAPSSDTIH